MGTLVSIIFPAAAVVEIMCGEKLINRGILTLRIPDGLEIINTQDPSTYYSCFIYNMQ